MVEGSTVLEQIGEGGDELADGSFMEKKDSIHTKQKIGEENILASSAIVEAEVEEQEQEDDLSPSQQ